MNIIIKVLQIGIILISLHESSRAETSQIDSLQYTDLAVFNQAAKNVNSPQQTDSFSSYIRDHQADIKEANRVMQKEFMSARFKLSRSLHNENLQIIDTESSNEHLQASMVIKLDELPKIQNYLQFFSHAGIFQ